jgi:membrane protein DedA with SNARE-associated domain
MIGTAGVAAGLGAGAALGLLALTEAGLPVLIPADLLMLFVGERANAGALPLWAAVVAIEAATVVGTAGLFVLARGPGRAVVTRLGRRIGLTEERLDRIGGRLHRGGRPVLALGRCTPGLRTLTVVGAALSGIPAAVALGGLLLGGTIFVQAHLALGFALGAAARAVLAKAGLVLVAVAAAVSLVGFVVWVRRRGATTGGRAFEEATCPACLVVGAVAEGRFG